MGDIGGFYDGVFIVLSVLVGFFAKAAFQANYLDGMLIEKDIDSQKTKQQQVELQNFASNNIKHDSRLEQSSSSLISMVVQRTFRLQVEIFQTLCRCLVSNSK